MDMGLSFQDRSFYCSTFGEKFFALRVKSFNILKLVLNSFIRNRMKKLINLIVLLCRVGMKCKVQHQSTRSTKSALAISIYFARFVCKTSWKKKGKVCHKSFGFFAPPLAQGDFASSNI